MHIDRLPSLVFALGAGLAVSASPAAALGETYLTHDNVPAAVKFGDWQKLLMLELPAGNYVLDASVALTNPSFERIPVLCALRSPEGGASETLAVQLESEHPQAEGRASGASLSPNFAYALPEGGVVYLVCMSNGSGDEAIADGRQMTATRVAAILRQ